MEDPVSEVSSGLSGPVHPPRGLLPDSFRDHLSHADGRLMIKHLRIKDPDTVFLQQKNNGRSAVLEESLLLAALDHARTSRVTDPPDEHGSDLHLYHGSEMLCFQKAVLACVFDKYGKRFKCGGPDGMVYSGNPDFPAAKRVVRITIAVIMADTQAEDHAPAALISSRQGWIPEKGRDRIA